MGPTSYIPLIAAFLAAPATAVDYTVSTCADLADVDDTLVTGLTIDASTFACDEYTRFRVRNTMTLKATFPAVEFGNFSLKVLGELTVEPDVTFTGVKDEVKNGGVLYVQEGASATFMGASNFSDNSICGEGCFLDRYVKKKGGAVHNKGMLTFEGDATFVDNFVGTRDDTERGQGAAISNIGSGSVWFQSKLTVEGNEVEGSFEGIGGAFYNCGDIIVDGESYFASNIAARGGAIYQTKIGTMTFNAMATFFDNTAYNDRGGAIANEGGVVTFNAGSLFEENDASGSGDGGAGGAISNKDGGIITLTGSTTFKGNEAYFGGAIFNNRFEPVPTTTFPDDAIFVDNRGQYCDDINNGAVFDDDQLDECPVV